MRYAKPLALFISLNVVHYLSVSLFNANTFTTPLSYQLHLNDYYPAYASRQVERKLQKGRIDYAEIEKKFDEKTGVVSRTLIFLFIPLHAIIFYACFFRWRRYFAEHVIVTTHFWCFVLLLLAVVVSAVVIPALWWADAPTVETVFAAHDNAISAFLQCCIAIYLTVLARRVYRASWW